MRELLLSLAAAVIHELGHIFCALLLKIPFSKFALRPNGAVMTFDFSKTSYFYELCVHLSGSALSLTCAAAASWLFGGSVDYFVGLSVVFSAINLLPLEGFDGGGALNCIMMAILSPDRAYFVCRAVSIIVMAALWAAVLWIELRVYTNAALILFVLYIMIFHTAIVNFQ